MCKGEDVIHWFAVGSHVCKEEDVHGSGLPCRMCRLRVVKYLQYQVQHTKIIVLKMIKFAEFTGKV